MKKIVLALVAMMTMTAAQAQQGDNQQGRRERRNFDKTEMVKRRTDDAVKKYKLNEDQAAKLLTLNTKFADKMGPGMGMRGGRGGRGGARPAPNFGGNGGGNGQPGQRPELTEEQKQQMEAQRKEREETMKQYDAELQTIMTPEQYKSYQADQEEMRKNMGRRGGGQRERRQADNK